MNLLDAAVLADRSGKRPLQLSAGQRQRVNLARALMNDPRLPVVDEPTSALDWERGAAVVELIIKVGRERAAATLLVTHDHKYLHRMDNVYRVADGFLMTDMETHAVLLGEAWSPVISKHPNRKSTGGLLGR